MDLSQLGGTLIARRTRFVRGAGREPGHCVSKPSSAFTVKVAMQCRTLTVIISTNAG
jgi:hypothetical protein